MTQKTRTTLGLASALMLAIGAAPAMHAAADGILIVQKTTSGTTSRTSEIQIDQTRMRSEVGDASGIKQVIIFDGAKQVMVMINMDKKTYNELTKADVDRLGSQMSGAMAQLQAQLDKMPEAQRAQMQQMMAGRGMPGAAPAKTEYKKTGTDKVGRWTCDKYEGYQNGQKTVDLCTVEPAAFGVAAGDFEISKQFAEFFKKLLPQNADQAFSVGRTEDQGFSGIPVRRTSTVAGKETTMEIQEVSRQAFPDSLFAVPAGFTKVDFMGGRGRGGE